MSTKRPKGPKGPDPSGELNSEATPGPSPAPLPAPSKPSPGSLEPAPAPGGAEPRSARAKKRGIPASSRPAYRPTKYTKQRQELILACLRTGMTQQRAIERAGIGKSTFHEWRQIGEKKPVGHHLRSFADGITSAYAQLEAACVSVIRKAAVKNADPSWAAWMLTHCKALQGDWAPPKQQVDHAGTVGFTLRDIEDIEKARAANRAGPAPASTDVG